MAPIWGGSRVRVTIACAGLSVGTEGVNLGNRQGPPGGFTLLIRLDDGKEVRVPLLALEKIEERHKPDGHDWKNDIPPTLEGIHVNAMVEEYIGPTWTYQIWGRSERWCVVRSNRKGMRQRTRFYGSRDKARKVLDDLTDG